MLAGAFAFQKIESFLKGSVDAALEAEAAQNQLQAALDRYPKLAGTSAAAFADLNTQLEDTTRFSHVAAEGAEAILARFNLTAAQIKETIPLVADYAAVTGKDLPDAASSLGKSFLGTTRALKAIGINYKSTKNQAKDFANIMDLVRQKVGGFAEREGQTAGGQLKILGNQFRVVKEQIGRALLPIIIAVAKAFIGLVHGIVAVVDAFREAPAAFAPAIALLTILVPEVVAAATAVALLTAAFLESSKAAAAQHDAIEASVPLLDAYTKATIAHKHSKEDLLRTIDQQIAAAKAEGASEKELDDIRTAGVQSILQYERATKRQIERVQAGRRAIVSFAGLTGKKLNDWAASVSGQLGFVDAAFSKISSTAHLTSDKILKAFRKQIDSIKEFSKNLKELSQKGLGDYAAKALIALGPAAPKIAEALNKGPKDAVPQFSRSLSTLQRLQDTFAGKVIKNFQSTSDAAGSYIDKLNQIPPRIVTDVKLNLPNVPFGPPSPAFKPLPSPLPVFQPKTTTTPSGTGGDQLPPHKLTTTVQIDGRTVLTYERRRRVLLGA